MATALPSPSRRARPAPPGRSDLRVVRSPQVRRRRLRAVGLLFGISIFGVLFGLVVFQTLLVQRQQRLDGMEQEVQAQQAQFQRLRLEVAQLESPERVIAEATGRLGMVPATDTVYLVPQADAAAGAGPAADGTARAGSGAGTSGVAPAAPDTQTWTTVKPALGAR